MRKRNSLRSLKTSQSVSYTHLNLLDVLMILSVEGFPLAVLEAASAGTPVVACNVAGAEE